MPGTMKEFARRVLNHKLNAKVSRRTLLQGAAGLVSVTALGGGTFRARADEAKLGGPLNFFGYDGEQAQNVAKPFLEKNEIQLNASFAGAADETLTRFNT